MRKWLIAAFLLALIVDFPSPEGEYQTAGTSCAHKGSSNNRGTTRNWREDPGSPVGAVPEPSAGLLFTAGALIVAYRFRKNRKNASSKKPSE